jgi:RNA polymerase sigma-70 factor (ECF subfamily)
MDLAKLADEALMQALQNAVDESVAGDLFSELFRRYEMRVRAWCQRLTGDRDLSVDLTQEIFFKAYRNMHSFRGAAKFSTWLYSIAHNHCLNSIKKRASEPVDYNDAVYDHVVDDSAVEPYTAIERNQSYRLMWELISATLNPLETRVMTLHYGHDVPLAEITGQLALSNPSGAKAYIVSARRKLQGALRHHTLPLAG